MYTHTHIYSVYIWRERERSLTSKVVFSCRVSQLVGRGAASIGSQLKWTLGFLFWWNKFHDKERR